MGVELKIPRSIAYVFIHAQQQIKITCAKLVVPSLITSFLCDPLDPLQLYKELNTDPTNKYYFEFKCTELNTDIPLRPGNEAK